MMRRIRFLGRVALTLSCWPHAVSAADSPPPRRYFAHEVREDRNGVIAPWYRGQNGQCDFRVRVAAETLKRYPWADTNLTSRPAPHFVFNGQWAIDSNGTIRVNSQLSDWDNGDLGQRSASLLSGLVAYYRYTGDPAAIGLITLTADYLLDYAQTPPTHPWPGFLISCPTKGKAYRHADPQGFIQLDVSAQVGSGLVAAYKLTGQPRYLEAVRRWADLLAQHCDFSDGAQPWNRYANPEDVKWDTRLTAGVSLILQFLDDVIGLGYQGQGNALVKARDAGDRYLREVLLPAWSLDPTFGHHFWDWLNQTATCSAPCYTAEYLMNRAQAFPGWQRDTRNFLSLFFCRASVDPNSAGGTYSGAWAFPESSSCCGKSLQYPTLLFAATLARYGELAESPWARELARRQSLLCTYDAHETGVVEDGMDGGAVVAGAWFNLAHPWPLRCALGLIAWQPGLMGANRENHIVRATSVVRDVHYGKGRIAYATFDASSPCEEVLRLSYPPERVSAGGVALKPRRELSENGYRLEALSNGDCLVRIRHDGSRDVEIQGADPQALVDDDQLEYEGSWSVEDHPAAAGRKQHVASRAGGQASVRFVGNQVRLIGSVGPQGGQADVFVDGTKQLCGIDFWCPQPRDQQVLYYKNGLAQGPHTLKIASLGTRNPLSSDTRIWIDAVQTSAAQGETGYGEGAGPTETQRVIFGYVGRQDYLDSTGNLWRPATEFTLRLQTLADPVPLAFWTEPQLAQVAGTMDPELYRYGIHGRDFTAYFTVAPAHSYHVRLKFCQANAPLHPGDFATCIEIQGNEVVSDMDVAATAGGLGRAVDLVFLDVQPKNGVIAIRSRHRLSGQAAIQAIEVGPGPSAEGAKPVKANFPPVSK